MAGAYDVAIVGGGIVGCSVFFELDRVGYSCVLLEKNENLLSEASSGNSGMLHTGFDAPANSLELQCIKRCVQKVFGVFDKLGVPYNQNGSIMVAWNPEQVSKLEEIKSSAHANGVSGVHHLPLPDLYKKEPNLSRQAQGALWIPEETVLEPCVYGVLLAHHARKHGAKILTSCEVTDITSDADGAGRATLTTSRGPVKAKVVISCTGLHGDTVQQMAGISNFTIKPRKGQYAVFGHATSHLLHSSILPVPTEKTKGIIVFKTVHNNVLVGPTAEDVASRERAAIDPSITRRLLDWGRQVIPELTSYSPVGQYTGTRPATEFKDYQIHPYPDRHWITVGGIRSTGVSGSLGIAEYVAGMVSRDFQVEPTRGASRFLDASDWTMLPSGSLYVEGHVYGVSHPITLYGTKEGKCDSKL